MAYLVAVCNSYLFACGKTSNMQLAQNNLSLQAIWLEFNWIMTDPIYSVSRWLIFFCCVFDNTCNCFCFLLNRMFAFMLHSEYTTGCFMPKSVVWHNITSKQDRHFIGLFWTVILFNSLNVNMFFLFVCLSDCKCCISDTLAWDFFPHSWCIEGKSSCATHSMIFEEKNRNYFSRALPTAKIKIREK